MASLCKMMLQKKLLTVKSVAVFSGASHHRLGSTFLLRCNHTQTQRSGHSRPSTNTGAPPQHNAATASFDQAVTTKNEAAALSGKFASEASAASSGSLASQDSVAAN